jgi:hypothetical protein
MQTAEGASNVPCLTAEEVQLTVTEAVQLYFESRRLRVDDFVDRHFSLAGSLTLHRKALGWDVLKAPMNILLAVPNIGMQLSAVAARRLRAKRMSHFLASRKVLLDTAVGREIEWLVMTDLLELPYRQGDRICRRDALAEAILASPHLETVLRETFDAIGRRGDDPALRKQLEQAMATYTGTRAAAAEITTTLITLGAGMVALKRLTPGAILLGPALAGVMAQQAAVASFPLGTALGGLWYAAFPVTATPSLIAGVTGSLMAAGAVAAAFSGIVADPIQRRLGLHHRRIRRLVDALERQFNGDGKAGFVVRDQYIARLLSLLELLASAYRQARS